MAAPMTRCGNWLMKMRVFSIVHNRSGSSLFSPVMLGISAFKKRRLEIKDTIGNYRDKFLTRMEDELRKPDQKIFTCDLVTLIEISETEQHLDLLIGLINKYTDNMKKDPFQTQINFGPLLLRMLHAENKVDEAYSLFIDKNSNVSPWFRKTVCFQLMMDMLYKAERYEDIVSLYPHAQECLSVDSVNLLTCVFAALYQMNTQKALDHLLFLLNEVNMKQLKISSRTLSFAVMLPLNQKKPDIALDIMYSPACERLMEKVHDRKINFKLLAFIQLGRVEEAVEILESMRRVYSLEGELLIYSETIEELQKAISETDDLDLKHKFSILKPALYRAGLVYPQTFHEFVTAPIFHNRFRTSFRNSKHNYSPKGRRKGFEEDEIASF